MPPENSSWSNFDFDENPTAFEGLAPIHYHELTEQKHPSGATSLAHGTSAAGARAFTTQLIAFYFRAPVRIDGEELNQLRGRREGILLTNWVYFGDEV